jgi:hypothetical protein
MTRLLCFFLLVGSSVIAQGEGDLVRPPKEAASRTELATHFGTTIGFGKVEKWEFTSAGRKLMVFGYGPYSGRAACYLHAYYYAAAKQKWFLFIDRLVEPATKLSAEISDDHFLTFKDRDGKVVVKESVDALPP